MSAVPPSAPQRPPIQGMPLGNHPFPDGPQDGELHPRGSDQRPRFPGFGKDFENQQRPPGMEIQPPFGELFQERMPARHPGFPVSFVHIVDSYIAIVLIF